MHGAPVTEPSVVTRFAPSPTGFLHIGGARTALFNWLFARHHKGKFLLRIEDTDRERSSAEATEAIFASLRWLGLDWDGEAVSQWSRIDRHREAAETLLATGAAFRCYATPEEIAEARATARRAGVPFRFDSPWRDRAPDEEPAGLSYTVRLRAERTGETAIDDAVQGRVTWNNQQLDDLVLLRSDGTPTYMLAVVVDDHDMGVTHVIRGTDHLTNAARQTRIFTALGWPAPVFAHIPLIHGADGQKYSKRHGAVSLEEFAVEGFLPGGMRNYLARLGWSHGDDEVFDTRSAIEWFTLDSVGRSAARFDRKKLLNVNAAHLRSTPSEVLVAQFVAFLDERRAQPLDSLQRQRITAIFPELTPRARTLLEMEEMAHFALCDGLPQPDERAAKILDGDARKLLAALTPKLAGAMVWERKPLEDIVREFADNRSIKLGSVAQPVRVALTGRTASPSVFDVMAVLGREESLSRLEARSRVD